MSDQQAYVSVEVTSDAATLADNAVDHLRDAWPGWNPREGSLSVIQIEAIAPMAQNAAEVAGQMPPAVFRKFGTDLWGISYVSGAAATATTSWTLSDDDGHTIEADTLIAIGGIPFTVDNDVVVASGSFVAPSVAVTAVDEGTAANALSSPVEGVSAADWVDDITVVGATAGGADPESDTAYQNRISTLFTLMNLSPVTPQQFALLARYAGVAVGRSTAVPGWDPATGTSNNGRYMYIAVTGPAGGTLSSTDLTTIQNFLRARREINFVINVVNHGDPPTVYVTIDVTYTATFYAGYDEAATEANVQSAVEQFLSPLTWGQPLTALVSGSSWETEKVVRVDKLIAVIDSVPGVNYVADVTIADHSGGLSPEANGDIILTGAAPLVEAGTVTRT